MSVRRLADDSQQPASFAFSPENEAWARGQVAKYPEGRQASAVIPLLWRAQKQGDGWLSQAAIEAVARVLGMPRMRVLEVATFYTMFNLEPVGRHFVQLCGTTPCALRGADELKPFLEGRIGHMGQVSADGMFSWLEVECLGACCNAPMVQINDDYYEDLSIESLGALLDDLAAGRPVKVGPQVTTRVSSDPAGGLTTLTDPALFDGSSVGAWQGRFQEETAKRETERQAKLAAETGGGAPGASTAKPDAGRPEDKVAQDPNNRTAQGKTPLNPPARADAADSSRTNAGSKAEDAAMPVPESSRSYVATPVAPDAGRLVAAPAAPAKGGPTTTTEGER